jgi:hypothetical protein
VLYKQGVGAPVSVVIIYRCSDYIISLLKINLSRLIKNKPFIILYILLKNKYKITFFTFINFKVNNFIFINIIYINNIIIFLNFKL